MKKTFLIMAAIVSGLIGFAQSHLNNVDMGIFPNGYFGSNGGSGAHLAFTLKIKPAGLTYTATPVAEEWAIYLAVPKADFTGAEVMTPVQYNAPIFGATTMLVTQPIIDIGDPLYYYYGISMNGAGINLNSLSAANWSYGFTVSFSPARPISGIRIIDQTNNAFLSAVFGGTIFTTLLMTTVNQLTPQATILPVDLLSFSGYKDGTRNQLKWTTSTEQNNRGFEVQRSLDGVNYSPLGFVNSLANGGNSSVQLNYTFTDNNVAGDRQFYRLRQVDFDGRNKISNVVLIKGDKPITITINGMFPNPATTIVNMLVGSPAKDKVDMVISDMSGRIMMQRSLNVETGNNTLPVDVSALAGGTYIVKMISSGGDVTTGKFVKQ